jgi:hypothetical protein
MPTVIPKSFTVQLPVSGYEPVDRTSDVRIGLEDEYCVVGGHVWQLLGMFVGTIQGLSLLKLVTFKGFFVPLDLRYRTF